MPFAFLLALQASGMVFDWLGNKQQIQMGRMGAKLEQAGIESNLQSARLESEDASLESMKKLRQTLGTQAAIFAARGTAAYAGSALSLKNESVNNFNSDTRVRRMNLLGNEARIKAGKTISQLHESASEAEVWQGFRKSVFNKIPISSLGQGKFGG